MAFRRRSQALLMVDLGPKLCLGPHLERSSASPTCPSGGEAELRGRGVPKLELGNKLRRFLLQTVEVLRISPFPIRVIRVIRGSICVIRGSICNLQFAICNSQFGMLFTHLA